MPDSCCVAGCPNVGTHGGIVRYFTMPQVINNKGDDIKRLSSLRREKWIAGVKAKKPNWEPKISSRICSFHFVSGRKAILTDVKSPDWVPTLFMGTSNDDKQESETVTVIKSLIAKKQQEMEDSKVTVSNERPIAIYMLSSTHERWKDVKKELSLQSDDALAKYFLNLFETGLHPVGKMSGLLPPATPQATTLPATAPPATISLVSSNGRDDRTTQQLPGKSQDMILIPVCLQPVNTSPVATTQNTAKIEKQTTKTRDDSSDTTAPSTSVSMATGNGNDVVDIPLSQPIGVKKEREVREKLLEVNKQKGVTLQVIKPMSLTRPRAIKPKTATPTPQATSPTPTHFDINDDKVTVVWRPPNHPTSSAGSSTDGPLYVVSKSFLAKLNKNTIAVSNSVMKPVHYMCKCSKRFTSPQLLEEHKRQVHGTIDKYKCRHCCLTYKSMGGLTRHNVRDHPGPVSRPYPCAVCDKSFKDKHSLIRHQRMHSENTNFRCEFCKRNFKDRVKFGKHKADVHVTREDGTTKNTGFECCQCGYVYKTKNALSNHESTSCDGWAKLRNSLSCGPCQISFEDLEQLKEHLKEAHQTDVDVSTGEGKNVSVCACGKVFHGKNAAIVHRCAQRQICPHCDKTFKHAISLRQHIACKHSAKKPEYKCKHCNRVYNRPHNLRSHERTHVVGQKKYKCKQCVKEYMSKQSLTHHVQYVHKGVRSLCSVCGKGFTTPTILNHHMRIHKKSMSHHCAFCNKGFYDAYTMRCHMKSHTGTKDLKCKYCDRMFGYSSSRSLHHRTQHPTEHYAEQKRKAAVVMTAPEEESESMADNTQEGSEDVADVWDMLTQDVD